MRFGYKSSLIIVGSAYIGNILFPSILKFIGLNENVVIFFYNVFVLPYIIVYVKYFIERKIGYCKNFWKLYVFIGIFFLIINYCWLYLNFYI